mgnify:CR=1 FL=1
MAIPVRPNNESYLAFKFYEYISTASQVESLINVQEQVIKKGEYVYDPSSDHKYIFEVVEGAVKLGSYTDDGDEFTFDVLFKNDFFGAVVSAGTFTHGHVGPDVFDELLRITKPGGLFVLSINSKVFIKDGFQKKFLKKFSKKSFQKSFQKKFSKMSQSFQKCQKFQKKFSKKVSKWIKKTKKSPKKSPQNEHQNRPKWGHQNRPKWTKNHPKWGQNRSILPFSRPDFSEVAEPTLTKSIRCLENKN